jgi:hypothetical protein
MRVAAAPLVLLGPRPGRRRRRAWESWRGLGDHRSDLGAMRIVAVDAGSAHTGSVPLAGGLPMDVQAPVGELLAVTRAALGVGLLEAHGAAVVEHQQIEVRPCVAAIAPAADRAVLEAVARAVERAKLARQRIGRARAMLVALGAGVGRPVGAADFDRGRGRRAARRGWSAERGLGLAAAESVDGEPARAPEQHAERESARWAGLASGCLGDGHGRRAWRVGTRNRTAGPGAPPPSPVSTARGGPTSRARAPGRPRPHRRAPAGTGQYTVRGRAARATRYQLLPIAQAW